MVIIACVQVYDFEGSAIGELPSGTIDAAWVTQTQGDGDSWTGLTANGLQKDFTSTKGKGLDYKSFKT